MSRFAFDTHTFVKCLTRAGMDEQQAEALVEWQVQLINDSLATKQDIEEIKRDIEALRLATEQSIEKLRLATKRDIEEVKRDIEALRLATEQSIEKLRLATEQSIEALRLETKKDIADLKTDMQKMELRLTLRLGSVIIAAVGVFAALIKFLP